MSNEINNQIVPISHVDWNMFQEFSSGVPTHECVQIYTLNVQSLQCYSRFDNFFFKESPERPKPCYAGCWVQINKVNYVRKEMVLIPTDNYWTNVLTLKKNLIELNSKPPHYWLLSRVLKWVTPLVLSSIPISPIIHNTFIIFTKPPPLASPLQELLFTLGLFFSPFVKKKLLSFKRKLESFEDDYFFLERTVKV